MDFNELLDYEESTCPRFSGWSWWGKHMLIYNGILILSLAIAYYLIWDDRVLAYRMYVFTSTLFTLLFANVLYFLAPLLEFAIYKVSAKRHCMKRFRLFNLTAGVLFSILVVFFCVKMVISDIIFMSAFR